MNSQLRHLHLHTATVPFPFALQNEALSTRNIFPLASILEANPVTLARHCPKYTGKLQILDGWKRTLKDINWPGRMELERISTGARAACHDFNV